MFYEREPFFLRGRQSEITQELRELGLPPDAPRKAMREARLLNERETYAHSLDQKTKAMFSHLQENLRVFLPVPCIIGFPFCVQVGPFFFRSP